MEVKKASVNEIWNALKEDEATRSIRRSASRTTVDWNSYHIRDAIKPKKKTFPTYDTHLADYSLMEAAHLFRNSEGTLEVGCPYDCRDKCRSRNREEECKNEMMNGVMESDEAGDRPQQPDLVVTQYAKLKAAYQAKLRKEKLATLSTCVDQMKEDIVSAEAQNQRDAEAVGQKIPVDVEKLDAERGEPDGDLELGLKGDGDLGLGLKSDGALGLGLKDDGDLGLGLQGDVDCFTEEQEPVKREICEVVPISESRSVRFALPEEEELEVPAATTEDGKAGEHQGLANALNRDLNALTDAVGGVRLAALQRLQSTLFESTTESLGVEPHTAYGGDETKLSSSQDESRRHSLGWAAEELVIKPLLRRFGDPSEKCRILAIVILQNPLFKRFS